MGLKERFADLRYQVTAPNKDRRITTGRYYGFLQPNREYGIVEGDVVLRGYEPYYGDSEKPVSIPFREVTGSLFIPEEIGEELSKSYSQPPINLVFPRLTKVGGLIDLRGLLDPSNAFPCLREIGEVNGVSLIVPDEKVLGIRDYFRSRGINMKGAMLPYTLSSSILSRLK